MDTSIVFLLSICRMQNKLNHDFLHFEQCHIYFLNNTMTYSDRALCLTLGAISHKRIAPYVHCHHNHRRLSNVSSVNFINHHAALFIKKLIHVQIYCSGNPVFRYFHHNGANQTFTGFNVWKNSCHSRSTTNFLIHTLRNI